jgi:putative pyruvate formate lyase activating enzyme
MDPYSGTPVTPQELADVSHQLAIQGATNINYVGGEPTPNLHLIIRSLLHFSANIALLWNSNFYCSKETLILLYDLMDLWLPDFKYGNNTCGQNLSKIPNYFEIVARNHQLVYKETVKPKTSGMIIRHLILPGHTECCSLPILNWLKKQTPNTLVNIMDQYHPDHQVLKNSKFHNIKRRITQKEYMTVLDTANSLGLVWKPVS